jgi:predicted nucleic acid-binding protein
MILDTSVLIDIDRGVKEEKIEKLASESPHTISSITKAEFFTGINKREDTNEEKAREILSIAQEIPFQKEIAEKAGELIARKHEENLSIGLNNIYIAATAIQNNQKILTKDTEDFQQIKELKVENWDKY